MHALVTEYRINETNLNRRKQFIRLSDRDVRVLKRLAGWAERVADSIARAFYDFQFAFPPTRVFFEAYAQKRGLSLAQLRQALEQAQAGYFRQIFKEAAAGGQYGSEYFERRLQVGKLHNVIDLPLKWYIGSYALYQDLVRKHLVRHFFYRPRFRARAERAIFTVFNYDVQAVVDAFFYDYLQFIGLDLASVQVHDAEHDLSEHYGQLKAAVRGVLEEAARTARRLGEASQELSAATEQLSSAAQEQASALEETAASLEQITSTVQQNAEKAR